jgi:Flp pilus assembly protein TadD
MMALCAHFFTFKRVSKSGRSRLLRWTFLLILFIPKGSIAQTESEYQRGLAAFRSGDYATATDFFAKAETVAPGTTDALVFEAKSLVHLQNFSQAESALRRYIRVHPDSDEALYFLGFVLHRENKTSESLEI